MLETGLAPRELLGELLATERAHGRTRDFPNAPRTLDLDIALYGERVVREPGLVIPHPRLLGRAFVLLPLAEIAPDRVIGGRTVREALDHVDTAGIERLLPFPGL